MSCWKGQPTAAAAASVGQNCTTRPCKISVEYACVEVGGKRKGSLSRRGLVHLLQDAHELGLQKGRRPAEASVNTQQQR